MLRTTVSRVGDSLPDIYIDNETAIPPRGKFFERMTVFPPILIPLFVPFCERLCMMRPEALSDSVIRYQ